MWFDDGVWVPMWRVAPLEVMLRLQHLWKQPPKVFMYPKMPQQ